MNYKKVKKKVLKKRKSLFYIVLWNNHHLDLLLNADISRYFGFINFSYSKIFSHSKSQFSMARNVNAQRTQEAAETKKTIPAFPRKFDIQFSLDHFSWKMNEIHTHTHTNIQSL